jgi:hypothetical protein
MLQGLSTAEGLTGEHFEKYLERRGVFSGSQMMRKDEMNGWRSKAKELTFSGRALRLRRITHDAISSLCPWP